MKKFTTIGALLLLTLALPAWASGPGNVALEGSDATAFHEDPNYTLQLMTYLQHGSSLPVLVLGGVGLSNVSGIVVYDSNSNTYDLTGYSLSNYSAVYIESVFGCCTQADHSISAGDATAIGAFRTAGGSVGIENYGGGPAWGPILPAAVNALPASDFGGITDFGTAGGSGCTDGEIFLPFALAHGFTQPPVLGCWEHQSYYYPDFKALGFNTLVESDPVGYSFGTNGSAFMALGGTLGTPEPGTLIMFGTGIAGLAGLLRRKLIP